MAEDSHGTAADEAWCSPAPRTAPSPGKPRRTTKFRHWKPQSGLWDPMRNLHCCRVSRTPSRKRRRGSSPDLQTGPWTQRRPKWSLWKHQSKRWEMPTLRHSKFSRMRCETRFMCQVRREEKKRFVGEKRRGHGKASDTSCICGRGVEGRGGSSGVPSCRSSCADANRKCPIRTWKPMCPACSKSSTSCNGS